jgi:hypothetical protein
MLTDRYGLPISTSSETARDAYIAGCDAVLSAEHGEGAHLARALAADPDFALAHVALARARFLMADVAGARQSAARARACGQRDATRTGARRRAQPRH